VYQSQYFCKKNKSKSKTKEESKGGHARADIFSADPTKQPFALQLKNIYSSLEAALPCILRVLGSLEARFMIGDGLDAGVWCMVYGG
jgi:hypothetical protein